ncbi:MAG: rhodanese-like domain-containing protein, partial [Ardenticatenaceae bacterium]
EAIVVDPARVVEPYLEEARAQGLRIRGVTETHIHADFVSGARELAERTGAALFLSGEGGDEWSYRYVHDYEHRLLRDGDIFKIGNIRFRVLHTPGHTPEHICLLLTDTAGANRPMGIFTGDFVFVGSVGRPDLLEIAAGIEGTAESLARDMFHSLRRFRELPDHLQLWPGHGAGSACGKGLGAVPSSTVGYEKYFNWALQHDDEDAFVWELLAGQPEPPRYFAVMKRVNREGPAVLQGLPALERLPFERLPALLDRKCTVIDTRPAAAFAASHIPGTVNIPYEGSFLTWMGWLAPYDEPFYLIANSSRATEIMQDLLAIGLEHVGGYFDPGVLEEWTFSGRAFQSYRAVTVEQLAEAIRAEEVTVLDVRARSEWDEGHIPGARHLMLGYLPDHLDEIPADRAIVVQCRSGARSAIGASLLQARGFDNVMNLAGGLRAWQHASLPVEGVKRET